MTLILSTTVPDVDLIATTTVHPESASSISIVIEIKVWNTYNGPYFDSISFAALQFPEFCWFERVNYSVVLEEVSEEGSQVVQIENSVESPQETITETLSAGVVPNANYSVVVFAKIHTWNSSTAPHNFSECIRMLGGVIIADTAYVCLVPLHCFALSVCTSHELLSVFLL